MTSIYLFSLSFSFSFKFYTSDFLSKARITDFVCFFLSLSLRIQLSFLVDMGLLIWNN